MTDVSLFYKCWKSVYRPIINVYRHIINHTGHYNYCLLRQFVLKWLTCGISRIYFSCFLPITGLFRHGCKNIYTHSMCVNFFMKYTAHPKNTMCDICQETHCMYFKYKRRDPFSIILVSKPYTMLDYLMNQLDYEFMSFLSFYEFISISNY